MTSVPVLYTLLTDFVRALLINAAVTNNSLGGWAPTAPQPMTYEGHLSRHRLSSDDAPPTAVQPRVDQSDKNPDKRRPPPWSAHPRLAAGAPLRFFVCATPFHRFGRAPTPGAT